MSTGRGGIGAKGQAVQIRQNDPADLDQIRDQHYSDYLQQATALLEQEQKRASIPGVASQEHNSMAQDLTGRQAQTLDAHPSI
jgi:hypothetical protein